MTPSNITIPQMIAYLQRSVDEWTRGEEPWMKDAIIMESAIIEVLKTVGSLKIEWSKPAPLVSFSEDDLGKAIINKVALVNEILQLELMMRGATQPENIAGYRSSLHEKREALRWMEQSIRELKAQQKLYLQNKLATIDAEIEMESNAFDIEELKELRRRCVNKIEVIDAELKTS